MEDAQGDCNDEVQEDGKGEKGREEDEGHEEGHEEDENGCCQAVKPRDGT